MRYNMGPGTPTSRDGPDTALSGLSTAPLFLRLWFPQALSILSARFKVRVDLFLERGIITPDNFRIDSYAHGSRTHDHDTADPVSQSRLV